MNIRYLTPLLAVLLILPLLAGNSQDSGRTYFNVNKASVNLAGEGYDSDGAGTSVWNEDGTGFFRLEVPDFCTITSVYSDDGMFFGIDWTAAGSGALTTVEVDDPITGDGTVINPIGIDIGTGLSVIAGELVNTVTDTDTDTDNETITFDDVTPAVAGTLAAAKVVTSHCIPLSGTATYIGIYVSKWVPADATDTITATLFVDGITTGHDFSTTDGAAGSYGAVISHPLVQGHYCDIRIQITTARGNPDEIEINSAICNVQIL